MFEILHRVGIRSTCDRVYTALTTPAGIAGWWTRDTTGDGGLGGTLVTRFTADGKLLGGFELEVLEARPTTRIQWRVVAGPPEWIGTHIHFDLKTEGDYTVVLFRHEGWKEPVESMYHCSLKWAVFMMSLKSLVETGRGQPAPDDVRISNWH